MTGKPVGIDLGTYNSVVAYEGSDGELKIAKSDYGATAQGTVFPSFVKFDALGNPVSFGEYARLDIASPSQVVWGVKRLIGKGYEQIKPELGKFLYKIDPGRQGVVIRQGEKEYNPTEISAKILGWIKKSIENNTLNPFIGRPVENVVITHPAYFDEVEKNETRKATEQAGFSEVKLITEPEASALSYGLQLDPQQKPYIMVIDWGAGTLDIAIHQLILGKDGIPTMAKASPPHGNLHLGGIDMDDAIVNWVIKSQNLQDLADLRGRLRRCEPIDLDSEDTMSALRSAMKLNEEAQEAKIELSTTESTTRRFPYRGKQLVFTITRKQLEKEIEPLLHQFRQHAEWMVKDAGISVKDITRVLLVGGPMKMPCARRLVREVFSSNKKGVIDQLKKIEKYIEETGEFPPGADPMYCVAKGAALYAEQLWGTNGRAVGTGAIKKGRGMTSFHYGILLSRVVGTILIERETVLPAHGEAVLGGQIQIGGSQPVSMYKMELDPATFKYQYVVRGNYDFSPCPDSAGQTQFYAALDIDDDANVTATFVDSRTGSKMTLIDLDSIGGPVIPKPVEPKRKFITDIDEPNGTETHLPQPTKPIKFATPDMVQTARRKARGHLQLARQKLNGPDITANAKKLVQDAFSDLEKTVAALPAQGPAPYKNWEDVQHRCEELRNRLHARGLLTEQEEQLLSME